VLLVIRSIQVTFGIIGRPQGEGAEGSVGGGGGGGDPYQ
jgi:hypothetical protein